VDDAALSDAAELALDSPVVTRAVALSRWIAESDPRPLTPRQVLRKPDIPVAAAVIGVAPPENPRTAADVPALNRPWNLALDMGLLRADGGTVTAGPALATWPPGDPDILAAWLDGLLTVSGSETGSPWDDTPATDILVFLTAVQEAADGVPLRDQLIKQAAELAERVGLDATFFWPEKRIANTTERLASFGAIGGGEVTSLGRWAAERLLDKLAEPEAELTAAELIAYLADCDKDERDEDAWAWLDAQPDPAEAARQLLTAGASMGPRLRWIAADVVGLLQEEALPVWREMAAVPGMGPHAKFALFTMEAGPEPDEGEWLWLAVESAAVALGRQGAGRGGHSALGGPLGGEAGSGRPGAPPGRGPGDRSSVSAVARGSHRGLRRVRRSGKAQREPVPATEGLARALEAADLADGADAGHREPRRAAPRDPGPVRLGRRPPARLPGPPRHVQRPVVLTRADP